MFSHHGQPSFRAARPPGSVLGLAAPILAWCLQRQPRFRLAHRHLGERPVAVPRRRAAWPRIFTAWSARSFGANRCTRPLEVVSHQEQGRSDGERQGEMISRWQMAKGAQTEEGRRRQVHGSVPQRRPSAAEGSRPCGVPGSSIRRARAERNWPGARQGAGNHGLPLSSTCSMAAPSRAARTPRAAVPQVGGPFYFRLGFDAFG